MVPAMFLGETSTFIWLAIGRWNGENEKKAYKRTSIAPLLDLTMESSEILPTEAYVLQTHQSSSTDQTADVWIRTLILA